MLLKVNAEGYAVRIRHIGASGTLAELDFDHDIGIVLLTQVPQAQTVPFRDRLLREIYTVLALRDADQPAGVDLSARLHRIDPPTPQALQEIFQRTPEALPLVSAHRGGAAGGFSGELPRHVREHAAAHVRHAGGRSALHQGRRDGRCTTTPRWSGRPPAGAASPISRSPS